MIETDQTIAAMATAPGGGVGILRLSGPEALTIAARCFRPWPDPLEPRRLYHGWWHDPAGDALDEVMVVAMKGPRSFTGEDVVEVHLHGGALNMRRCLEVCWSMNARPAGPGEFSRRAFLNGRMDLTRAEAIADLIAARTDRALAVARSHLSGGLHDTAMDARERLLRLRANLEVNIDFIDEDVPLIDAEGLADGADTLAADLAALAGTYDRGRLFREGARVVIVGAANAGKSSLFNHLVARDRAIVTELPGTTRDVLEETLDLEGVPVVLVDTAGLRDTEDPVEVEGISRTRRAITEADLLLCVVDPLVPDSDHWRALTPLPEGTPQLEVMSKADLVAETRHPLAVSAHTGAGIMDLKDAIIGTLGGGGDDEGGLMIVRERHQHTLHQASEALRAAAVGLRQGASPELVAVDIQEATDALGQLVGIATIEDVLDRLFASFCIGK